MKELTIYKAKCWDYNYTLVGDNDCYWTRVFCKHGKAAEPCTKRHKETMIRAKANSEAQLEIIVADKVQRMENQLRRKEEEIGGNFQRMTNFAGRRGNSRVESHSSRKRGRNTS